MEALKRTNVQRLSKPGQFLWAAGIEDTFITFPWPGTGRTLDEYELTEHYQRWKEDLGLFAELGLRWVRYGIPWHRIQPTRRRWDWSFPDRALERLLELGIQPIVDLVHYGLPPWIENAWLHRDFPDLMADYAGRVAERYRGRIHLYTPLNEPRITAWYCGKLGWWPPARRGWRGFLEVLNAVCRGIVATVHRLGEVDPEILPVQVDATDLYETRDPALRSETARRQEIVFLALDLVSGRVTRAHALFEWLMANGLTPEAIEWFAQKPVPLRFIGLNLYPIFTRKILSRTNRGLRTRMPYSSAGMIDRLAQLYWQRYGAPLFISETASSGSVRRRAVWMRDSIAAVRRVRRRGIPLVGYTWWPLFALVTWAYRQGRKPAADYLMQMGLWNVPASGVRRMQRVATPLVEQFRELVAANDAHVGPLAVKPSTA